MARALVVSPLVETRLPLQQLIQQCAEFKEIDTVQNLDEARASMSLQSPVSHAFISGTFSLTDVATFIDWAKHRQGRRPTAFVLLLKRDHVDSSTVANSMVMGIHGFLIEPFTIDAIENIVKLSQTISQKDSHPRMRAATGLMLTDMFPAPPTEEGAEHENLWKRVNATCDRVKHLTGQSVTMTVVQGLRKLSAAERVPQYDGASKRVRGLLERKIRETFGNIRKQDLSVKK